YKVQLQISWFWSASTGGTVGRGRAAAYVQATTSAQCLPPFAIPFCGLGYQGFTLNEGNQYDFPPGGSGTDRGLSTFTLDLPAVQVAEDGTRVTTVIALRTDAILDGAQLDGVRAVVTPEPSPGILVGSALFVLVAVRASHLRK